LLTSWTLFGLAAPAVSWLAGLGIFVTALYFAARLLLLARKIRLELNGASKSITGLRRDTPLGPRDGLPMEAYDRLNQTFEKSLLLLNAWRVHSSNRVVRRTASSEEELWFTASAKSSFTEASVYRIGQTRPVHVYYPIATDPQRQFETLDEKLDLLLERRRAMAADFLAPMPDESELEREFVETVIEPVCPDQTIAPLDEQSLTTMTWDRFEALVAILFERQRKNVIITLRTGDEGIDVLAGSPQRLEVIQCKHTACQAAVDADVIAELSQTFDGFRLRRLRTFRGCTIQPVLVTNGQLTRQARTEANRRDIAILDTAKLAELLKKFPCTAAEVEVMNMTRLRSMTELGTRLAKIIEGRPR
jgi:hypothetical protein